MRYDTRRITLSQDKAVAAQAEARRLALGGACAPITRSPAPTVRRTWRVRVAPQCSTNTRTRSVSALVADRLNGSPTTACYRPDDATHQIERASEGYHNLTARRRVAAQSLCRGSSHRTDVLPRSRRLIGVDRDARAVARKRLGEGHRRGAGERADLEHAACTHRPHQPLEEPHLLDAARHPRERRHLLGLARQRRDGRRRADRVRVRIPLNVGRDRRLHQRDIDAAIVQAGSHEHLRRLCVQVSSDTLRFVQIGLGRRRPTCRTGPYRCLRTWSC